MVEKGGGENEREMKGVAVGMKKLKEEIDRLISTRLFLEMTFVSHLSQGQQFLKIRISLKQAKSRNFSGFRERTKLLEK